MQNQYSILKSMDSFIEPLLKRVLQIKQVGISCDAFKVYSKSSSCGKNKNDCFELSIPYAGERLVWEVLFDSLCPEMAPDFIFNDSTFLMDPDIDIMTKWVPSLFKWNFTDGNALHQVLIEFLSYYKQHQIKLLENHDRLHFEYSMLISMTEICMEDVEVVLLPLGRRPTVAKFLIRISIDFSRLPPGHNKLQNEEVILTITFHGPDWNRIVPELYTPETLKQIYRQLGFYIPSFPFNKHLMDYVPEVKKLIEEKINFVIRKRLDNRRSFITNVIFCQRNNLVEYDAVEFYYIAILSNCRKFHYSIHFILPERFPDEKPQITLRSIYHTNPDGTLYQETLDDISYNHALPIRREVAKLFMYIGKAVQKFRENSMKNNYNYAL